jgi:preprotein translocase subunit SecD
LITGLILFQFGTGPVRGFAVTLSIGIIASFFSAVYVTRTLFLLYLQRKRATEALSI